MWSALASSLYVWLRNKCMPCRVHGLPCVTLHSERTIKAFACQNITLLHLEHTIKAFACQDGDAVSLGCAFPARLSIVVWQKASFP